MNHDDCRDIRIVLHDAADPAAPAAEHRLCLPRRADLNDLLRALEREAPDVHTEVRERLLRAAGRVLAYGTGDDLLPALKRQLASGGPIVFPTETTLIAAAKPIAERRDLS
jgi:hypothetical protein